MKYPTWVTPKLIKDPLPRWVWWWVFHHPIIKVFSMPRIYLSKEKWNEIIRTTGEDPDEWVKRLIDEELEKEGDEDE